jgi:hypothetical protein
MRDQKLLASRRSAGEDKDNPVVASRDAWGIRGRRSGLTYNILILSGGLNT